MRTQLTPGLWRYGTPADTPVGPTFVLAPFAGGSAYSVAEWTKPLLRKGQIALALQYPGRGTRAEEPSARRMTELADAAAPDVLAHSDGPLVLIGHSLGGQLAHELALRLEDAGRTIELLVVSAARPPGLNRISLAQILAMDRDAWRQELAGNGFGEQDLLSQLDVLDVVVPVLRSDYLLLARHNRAGGVVNAPMLAIGGDSDHWVTKEHLLAWAGLTRGGCTTALLPGGHFYYRDQIPDFVKWIRTTHADGLAQWSADA
jgi:medium-chain acyl-[acyl-carrier-protein] hydrolase